MALITQEITYSNFGKCLKAQYQNIEMIFTLDIGPRIISFTIDGGANVMFEDTACKYKNDDSFMSETFGPGSVWYIYGGHRLWISPEYNETYYPDNDPISYTVDGNTVTLVQDVQCTTNLQMSMSVTFLGDGKVKVLHNVANKGDVTKEFSVWALTVLEQASNPPHNGIEIVPYNASRSNLLPNRYLTVWPYSDMSDPRVNWGTKFLTLRNEPSIVPPFKCGLDVRSGIAFYLNQEQLFVKKFPYVDGATYPDNGCNFESYFNDAFLELESLSPIVSVAPGEVATHVEEWQLVANVSVDVVSDETKMQALVDKYI